MAEPEKNNTNPEPVIDATTKRKAAKELHERKSKERADEIAHRKHEYAVIKDSPALADIIEKGKQFANWHLKLAKDGVGAKNKGKDENGRDIIEDYYLTAEQRISELDQCKGIEQFVAYIEGNIK